MLDLITVTLKKKTALDCFPHPAHCAFTSLPANMPLPPCQLFEHALQQAQTFVAKGCPANVFETFATGQMISNGAGAFAVVQIPQECGNDETCGVLTFAKPIRNVHGETISGTV